MNKQKLQELLNLRYLLIDRKKIVHHESKHASDKQQSRLVPEEQTLSVMLRILDFIIIKYQKRCLQKNSTKISNFGRWMENIERVGRPYYLTKWECELLELMKEFNQDNRWHANSWFITYNIRGLYIKMIDHLFPKNAGLFGMDIEGDIDRDEFEWKKMLDWCKCFK